MNVMPSVASRFELLESRRILRDSFERVWVEEMQHFKVFLNILLRKYDIGSLHIANTALSNVRRVLERT